VFGDVVDSYVVCSRERRQDRDDNRHWPSEASFIMGDGVVVGKCLREQYFERKAYPYDREVAARIIRIQKVGKAIEGMEIDHARGAGIHIADDLEFQYAVSGIVVSGRIDAVYRDGNGNEVCVEYKTGEGFFFEKEVYGRSSLKQPQPKNEHVLQVMWYLKAHGHMPYSIIFYVNRDKMDTAEHKVQLIGDVAYINGERSCFHIEGMVKRWVELTEYLINNTVPPRDFTPEYEPDDVEKAFKTGRITKKMYSGWDADGVLPSDNKCMYMCAFRSTCLGMDDGEVHEPASAQTCTIDDTVDNANSNVKERRSGAIIDLSVLKGVKNL
jgi:hypothetical protein